MTTPQDTIETLEEELRAAEAELREILEKLPKMRALEDRRRKLEGGLFNKGAGEIDRLKDRLFNLKELEAQKSLPVITWVEEPKLWGKAVFVVTKKTPKRIYYQAIGDLRDRWVATGGTGKSSDGGIIDMEATFK